jgi:hypothetical protein
MCLWVKDWEQHRQYHYPKPVKPRACRKGDALMCIECLRIHHPDSPVLKVAAEKAASAS